MVRNIVAATALFLVLSAVYCSVNDPIGEAKGIREVNSLAGNSSAGNKAAVAKLGERKAKDRSQDVPFAESTAEMEVAGTRRDSREQLGQPGISAALQRSIFERAQKSPTGMIPTDEAIAIFQARVLANRDDYASWLVLGRLFLRRAEEKHETGDYEKAVAAFENTLRVRPQHIGGLTFSAIALNQLHRFKEALESAEEAIDVKPGNYTAMAEKGDALLALGQIDLAEEEYQSVDDLAPTAGAKARLARIAELRGQVETAGDLLESAVQLAKEQSLHSQQLAWYYWRQADLAWQSGQQQEAYAGIQESLRLHPDSPAAMGLHAQWCLANGRQDEAIETAVALADRSPTPKNLRLLHSIYSNLGRTEEAEQVGLQLESGAANVAAVERREMARFLADRGQQLVLAIQLVEDELAIRDDAYSHDLAAWVYFKNGEMENAESQIGQALQSGSQDPLLHYHAAKIYYATGQSQKLETSIAILRRSNQAFAPEYTADLEQMLKKVSEETPLQVVAD